MRSKNIVITIFIILSFVPSYPLIVNLFNSFSFNGIKGVFKIIFFTVSYIALASIFYKHKYMKIIGLAMILLWIVNLSITIILYSLFDCFLDSQLAMTILSSNLNESKNFIQIYWQLVLFIFFIFCILCFCVNQLPKHLSTKTLVILSSIMIITVGYKTSELIIKGKLNEPNFLLSERLFPYMSLGNYATLVRTYEDMQILNSVDDNRSIYDLITKNSEINIYILILGESVRRDHVSLYGYPRPTMPNMEKRRQEMYIFDQAISVAPITTMALTAALSIKPVNSNDFLLLGDNIINLANQAGYKTYWYSMQGSLGQYNTVITSIANMATVAEWLDSSEYDDVVLSKLEEALSDNHSDNQKKLIVFHTNGSHFVACNRYPEEDRYFVDGASMVEDCYDDSIRFTDKVIEQIYAMVSNQSASVFYFSDHGQVRRMKGGELDYFHGSVNPSRESIEVPQFIWYSPLVQNKDKKIGTYSSIYSTADNYYLLANWLGITHINTKEVTSPLIIDTYEPKDNYFIMDTRGNKFNYHQMRSDTNIGKK